MTTFVPIRNDPPRAARGCALLAAALALAGCASVPAPLQGRFAAFAPDTAVTQGTTGQAVRWGGTIAAVETGATATCFQLVGRPLDEQSRPILARDRSAGRFLACRQGFYDPQIFSLGRSLTVTGHVVAYETRKVGQYDYRQPRIAADVIYLWPRLDRVRVIHDPGPFFAPYPWGPWWW